MSRKANARDNEASVNLIKKTVCRGNVVVQRKGEYIMVPLEEALETPKAFRKDMYKIAKILSI